MKKYIQRLRLPYKLVVLTTIIIGFGSTVSFGQKTTFRLSQVLVVPQDVLIRTNGPQSVRINGRGAINTRHLEETYVVSGKDDLPYVYVIHKTLELNTWDEDQVKQEVEVSLETETPAQAAALRRALHPVLALAPGNVLSLNCELNIAQFLVNNGWFREDRNSITLTDGRVFPIKYLEIRNRFFIPKTARLDLELTRTNLILGDHSGAIKLQQSFGRVTGGCFRELTAQLTDAVVHLDDIEEANLTLSNSELRLSQVGRLNLSSSLSNIETDSIGHLFLNKSVSDHMSFHQVGIGNAAAVFFSTLTIGKLQQGWQLSGKRANLSVREVNEGLHSFQVDNQDGSVRFPLSDLSGYQLWCEAPTKNSYQLPTLLAGLPTHKTTAYYESGTTDSPSIIRLGGQRSEFWLRPE